MEYPFSSKSKGFGNYPYSRAQMENLASLDANSRSSILDDPFNNVQELMDYNTYAGFCTTPIASDPIYATYGMSTLQSTPSNYSSYDVLTFPQQNISENDVHNVDESSSYTLDENTNLNYPNTRKYNVCASQQISRPLSQSLAEKMLRALSLFKQSSGAGILAQVWVPIKHGDKYILSTCEQPYLLDQLLAGYREVSRAYTFPAENGAVGTFPGLPGRVFSSKIAEWTSNVIYYNTSEYLRVKHAVDHEVRGSIAIPVLDPLEKTCIAVLELVTVKEKQNFDSEMELVCRALQAVNLTTSSAPRIESQCLSKNQKAALAEIMDVVRAICHAHRLPLALTWIPCTYTENSSNESQKLRTGDNRSSNTNPNPNNKSIVCIEETACYVNEKQMQGFLHACAEHHLKENQGIVGKALESNQPVFSSDVKEYDISAYPLVHHARKFGLNAAVAIRLRSTYTHDDDYILEFFLPVNMKGSVEQQLLLNNLSGTMQKMCRSLRRVSDLEIVRGSSSSKPSNFMEAIPRISQPGLIDGIEAHGHIEQTTSGPRTQQDKKRSTIEKNVSLSVLQQYFSGSLKDAAKSIGVCPTTLKRICRQHGISRWPSRKINKVNRSLRKIQTVLDSVEGVEGGLRFDPTTGGLIASGSVIHDAVLPHKIFPFQDSDLPLCVDQNVSPIKLEGEECFMDANQVGPAQKNYNFTPLEYSGLINPEIHDSMPGISYLPGKSKCGLENNPQFLSQSSGSMDGADEMDTKMEGEDGVADHHQHSSSSISDTSNESGSLINNNGSSSPSLDELKNPQNKPSLGSKITVKASYKEDTVRFKFEPSSGCLQLYEEVGRRFKLQMGMFQLKYLDDEDEWVMLVSDSDLQECLGVLDFVGTRSVKFQVRDMPCSFGSSSGSNCFLMGVP